MVFSMDARASVFDFSACSISRDILSRSCMLQKKTRSGCTIHMSKPQPDLLHLDNVRSFIVELSWSWQKLKLHSEQVAGHVNDAFYGKEYKRPCSSCRPFCSDEHRVCSSASAALCFSPSLRSCSHNCPARASKCCKALQKSLAFTQAVGFPIHCPNPVPACCSRSAAEPVLLPLMQWQHSLLLRRPPFLVLPSQRPARTRRMTSASI